jgi:hypothetical protein
MLEVLAGSGAYPSEFTRRGLRRYRGKDGATAADLLRSETPGPCCLDPLTSEAKVHPAKEGHRDRVKLASCLNII